MGSFGKYILSAIIVLACFTTSVGLTSSIADMFFNIFNQRISHNAIASLIVVISAILSMTGVDGIISLTSPLLTFVYPLVLVIIIFNLLSEHFNRKIRVLMLATTGLISLVQALVMYAQMIDKGLSLAIEKLISFLPLYAYGFPWLVPLLILFAYGFIRRDLIKL